MINFKQAPISSHSGLPELNADRSFFESLFPPLSDFTEDQRLEFRSDALKIIQRMRREQTSLFNSQPVYTRYTVLQVPSHLPLPLPPASKPNYLPQNFTIPAIVHIRPVCLHNIFICLN